MEYLDIVDENGIPTGETVARAVAHREGIRHRTAHVWLVREKDGVLQILLQKRSDDKDSFPGRYDKSSAGHIPAGVDYLPSALRELSEELGVEAKPEELVACGYHSIEVAECFYGVPFIDRQVSKVFLMWCDREEDAFCLQKEEVSEVRWFAFDACVRAVEENQIPNCIDIEELMLVKARVIRQSIETGGKPDGIIFDVDGTLWDVTPIVARAWTEAIRRHGYDVTITGEELKQLFGRPMDVIFQTVLPGLSEKERAACIDTCIAYEHDFIAASETVPVYDGVVETIQALAKRYPLFIVSNCQKGYIELFLEKTGLSAYFNDFLCFGDTNQPKAVTMRTLIARNHLERAVYVGDTKGDEDASFGAGIPMVLCSYGFGAAEDPIYTIPAFDKLKELF